MIRPVVIENTKCLYDDEARMLFAQASHAYTAKVLRFSRPGSVDWLLRRYFPGAPTFRTWIFPYSVESPTYSLDFASFGLYFKRRFEYLRRRALLDALLSHKKVGMSTSPSGLLSWPTFLAREEASLCRTGSATESHFGLLTTIDLLIRDTLLGVDNVVTPSADCVTRERVSNFQLYLNNRRDIWQLKALIL